MVEEERRILESHKLEPDDLIPWYNRMDGEIYLFVLTTSAFPIPHFDSETGNEGCSHEFYQNLEGLNLEEAIAEAELRNAAIAAKSHEGLTEHWVIGMAIDMEHRTRTEKDGSIVVNTVEGLFALYLFTQRKIDTSRNVRFRS